MTRSRIAEKHAAFDALRATIDPATIRAALDAYEATGDHDHGRGPIAPGGPCGQGDDCIVRQARRTLALLTLTNDDLDRLGEALDAHDEANEPGVGMAEDFPRIGRAHAEYTARSNALRLRLSTIR